MRSDSPGDAAGTHQLLSPSPLLARPPPRPGGSEKSRVTLPPRRGSCGVRERRWQGPLGDERRAGRRGTGGGVPSGPECAGSAGEGRRRARQCQGSGFRPTGPFPAALPDSGGPGRPRRPACGGGVRSCRGPRTGVGAPGPCNPMLGTYEPGWSDICSEIAAFLSTFSFSTERHFKRVSRAHTETVFGVRRSRWGTEFCLRLRGPPRWRLREDSPSGRGGWATAGGRARGPGRGRAASRPVSPTHPTTHTPRSHGCRKAGPSHSLPSPGVS